MSIAQRSTSDCVSRVSGVSGASGASERTNVATVENAVVSNKKRASDGTKKKRNDGRDDYGVIMAQRRKKREKLG